MGSFRASWLAKRTHETALKSLLHIRQSRDLGLCLKPSDCQALENGVGLSFGREDMSVVICKKITDLSLNAFSRRGAGVRISRAGKHLTTG